MRKKARKGERERKEGREGENSRYVRKIKKDINNNKIKEINNEIRLSK